MLRRDFLKSSVALAAVAELGTGKANALVRAHNWGNYDFGSGPPVSDRLNRLENFGRRNLCCPRGQSLQV